MKILKCFSDLQDAEKYQYSKYEPIKLNFLFSKMKLYEEEAKCDVQKSIIYLNHSVLDADNTTLTRVLIHELIHINYPNYNEREVVEETERRMGILYKRNQM